MRFFKELKLKREIRKYQKRELLKHETREKRNNYIFWIIVGITCFSIAYYYNFSKDILTVISIFIMGLLIVDLFYSNWRLKRDLELYEKSQAVRDSRIIKSIEDKTEIQRNNITHLILKNESGYDIRTWAIGKQNSLIIGKTSRIRVDVDLTTTAYSALISKQHAILNRTDNGWYLEDLGSRNGTGLKRYSDNRKIKIGNAPIKVQSGDIIYIATTAILLK